MHRAPRGGLHGLGIIWAPSRHGRRFTHLHSLVMLPLLPTTQLSKSSLETLAQQRLGVMHTWLALENMREGVPRQCCSKASRELRQACSWEASKELGVLFPLPPLGLS
mmetsp:Transcript_15066/g.40719  ORF Transcript_15066/g.40719 Transcript_15066/m.40719 type:complete len:108 (-) Transcript_15066:737-1060(-)